MIFSIRWFDSSEVSGNGGSHPLDLASLAAIRQIPGVEGIVASAFDIPAAAPIPYVRLADMQQRVRDAGLKITVFESIPVDSSIKCGGAARDRAIDTFIESMRNVARAGIPVICYNFMLGVDWMRTDLAYRLPDGSTTLAYRDDMSASIDPQKIDLAAWTDHPDARTLSQYRELRKEDLWEHLRYFLRAVVPVAEECKVALALHPDDPPWDLWGIPRIIVDRAALRRVVEIYPSAANGLTFCTGSLGARAENDLPAMIAEYAPHIKFVHARNLRRESARTFHETAHMDGDIDMYAILTQLDAIGFRGAIRPDHGRQIWEDPSPPGYGLYDRALGHAYLYGLWEAIGRPHTTIPR